MSMAALVRRAKELGIIDNTIYTRAMKYSERPRLAESRTRFERPVTTRTPSAPTSDGQGSDSHGRSGESGTPARKCRAENRGHTEAFAEPLIHPAQPTASTWDTCRPKPQARRNP